MGEPGIERLGRAPRRRDVLQCLVATDARPARQGAARDERLVAQQLAAWVVARVAPRRRAQALTDDLEPPVRRPGDEVGELGAGAVVDHGGAEALELVARQLVIARAGVEALRGQLSVETGRRATDAVQQAVGPRLVGRRARGREAQVALLAKDLDLAAEGLAELIKHRLQAAADLSLVALAGRGEVRLGVVALEPGEPREDLGAEAMEGGVHDPRIADRDAARTLSRMPGLESLRERLAELADLSSLGRLAAWDQRTMMPPAGAASRAQQLGALQRLAHERANSDDIRPWVGENARRGAHGGGGRR